MISYKHNRLVGSLPDYISLLFLCACLCYVIKMSAKVLGVINHFQKVVHQRFFQVQKLNLPSVHFRNNTLYSTSSCVTKPDIKLVVFDKDGTLTCFDTMWAPWCEQIAKSLEYKTGRNIRCDLFQLFNYDEEHRKINKGVLAEKTQSHLQELVIEMLHHNYNITKYTAEKVVVESWEQAYLSGLEMVSTIKPVCNVRSIFSALKSAQIKIAICTSDNRPNTFNALHALNVVDLVDRVLCDGDQDNTAKPSPDNVFLMCKEFGLSAQQIAVVGDTPADTQMGRNSSAGLVFGVLSGVSNKDELEPDADFIVTDIEDAVTYILDPPTNKPNAFALS